MHREIIHQLQNWKSQKKRKPLIINGARQVGKSWIVKYFGEKFYSGNIHIINFEKRRNIHSIFDVDFDVNRILSELELLLNITFNKKEDLIFFDEIQTCPSALVALRYFYEDAPDVHLIAAGSLLDFEFRNIPYPVGRVQTLNMHPMTFYEFLVAKGKDKIAALLKSPDSPTSPTIQSTLYNELQQYFVIGGMPECVSEYLENSNMENVHQLQDELLYSFSRDFKKYQPLVNNDCLNDILLNSSKRIGNQTIYSKLSDRFSNPTIKKGVEVLIKARLLHKVTNVSVSGLPLSTSGNRFKLFYLDIGLLMRKSNFRYEEDFLSRNLIASYKGGLAEQFVAQQMIATQTDPLSYWSNTKPGTSSEVDFIIVRKGEILPIEVKFGKSGALKSLHILLNTQNHISKAIVLSQSQQGEVDKISFVPIFHAGFI